MLDPTRNSSLLSTRNRRRRRPATRGTVLAVLLVLVTLAGGNGHTLRAQDTAPLTVYTAKKIVTMEPSRPTAEAVAVANGRIVAVGDLDDLRPWTDSRPTTIDRRFAEMVLLPGLIDNHLHPALAAVLLPGRFLTPYDWDLPDRHVTGVRGAEAFRARLRALAAEPPEASGWLVVWGYHRDFHGELARADLDRVSEELPILVWQRSFHEIFLNSAGLTASGLDPQALAGSAGVDWEAGRFYETGLPVAMAALGPVILAPERYRRGLELTAELIHRGGVTTVADLAIPLFDLGLEWPLLQQVVEREETPFRVLLIANAAQLVRQLGPEQALARIDALPERNSRHLRFVRQAKLFADGAFYSQLMQLGPPGYIDGHDGEWLMTPAELEAAARLFWNAGYQLHVHANGDLGIAATLDVLERLLSEHPRPDHRFTLHHLGYSTAAQAERIARLGAVVSANPYYLWALGDVYAESGLGPDRADQISRLGSLVRAGVRVSLHSDLTMAPVKPLRLAEIAATRITAGGRQAAPAERLSVEQALRAVTIDAAFALRMETEIGSIAPGKRADFTVFLRDPTAAPAADLAETPLWGTVFEGRPHPIER